MSIIDRAAVVVMQAAHQDEGDAREIRKEGRAQEVDERLERARQEHQANDKEVRMNVTRAEVNFYLSPFGAVGQILSKAFGFAFDEGRGHEVANFRRRANLAGARADLAKTKADDASADIEARQREIDKASEQALTTNDRIKDAVKIA